MDTGRIYDLKFNDRPLRELYLNGRLVYSAQGDITYFSDYPDGKTNAKKTGKYFFNADYVVSSAVQCEFGTTGYRFENWKDSANRKFKSGQTIKINELTKNLSAEWSKALYAVAFYDSANESKELYYTARVPYGEKCDPPPPPERDGFHFAKWIVENGSVDDLNSVTRNLTVYADMRALLTLSYKWNDDGEFVDFGPPSGKNQEQIAYGEKIERYKTPGEALVREKRTVRPDKTSRLPPDDFTEVSAHVSQTVYFYDLSNVIKVTPPAAVVYEKGVKRKAEIATTLDPENVGIATTVKYRLDDSKPWQDSPFEFEDVGTYRVKYFAEADNYYSKNGEFDFDVSESTHRVTFEYDFYNESEEKIEHRTKVFIVGNGGRAPIETWPEIYEETRYFEAGTFDSSDWENVRENMTVKVSKKPREYSLKFYEDPDLNADAEILIGEIKAHYDENVEDQAAKLRPTLDGYIFNCWSFEKTTGKTGRRTEALDFEKVKTNYKFYAWMIEDFNAIITHDKNNLIAADGGKMETLIAIDTEK